MPAWNAEATIEIAIGSVLDQYSVGVHVLVCDDASQDGTRSVVQGVGSERVVLLSNADNLGPGRSRDRAIERATTPWVAFIDADDAWHPQRLWRLLEAGRSTGADVVFDDSMLCHHVGGQLVPWKPIHGQQAFGGRGNSPRPVRVEDYVTSERLLVHPLIRTEFIRRYRIRHSSRRFAEDAEFYLRLAQAGAKFCYVPEPLYHYRVTPGSLTAQARDPTLMRQCLQECALWDGWLPSVQDAFNQKIVSLRINEALYDFADAVRRGHLSSAAKLLLSHPGMLAQLPRRLTRQIDYQAHRILHGGSKR